MTYTDYVNALGALLAISGTITAITAPTASPSTNTDFNNILPRCIEFAELMMYRDPDMNFLATRTTDSTTTCTANSRALTLPSQLVIPMSLNVITPVATQPDAGTRNNVQIVQREFIESFFGTVPPTTTPSIPVYCTMITESNTTLAKSAILGPTPDAAYVCEWYGTFRPTALSTSNTSTFLSLYLPDLFISASMIFMSGYQRNFGAQTEDPRMGMSWSQLYSEQKKNAAVEEARKKSEGIDWTPDPATPFTSPRG